MASDADTFRSDSVTEIARAIDRCRRPTTHVERRRHGRPEGPHGAAGRHVDGVLAGSKRCVEVERQRRQGRAMPECQVAHRPSAGVRMKRANECVDQALTAASTTSPVADDDADLKMHGSERARHAREAIRARQPRGSFDARAIRELSQAAPTDPAQLRRTIRRSELRQIVPLADSTIYELERRGDFPQRFFLTARCVVWDLAEVEAWLRSRRQPGSSDVVRKAPVPDFRKRQRRIPLEKQ
jgi:prophage regulatory protein